jgi:23S rRNA pseudouridine1911/1915/1917 synthase
VPDAVPPANASTTRRFSVGKGTAGRRLDRFLASACGDISRSRLQKLIEDGAVRIDGVVERRVSRSTADGQKIEVDVAAAPAKTALLAEDIPLAILYEDDQLLILNKPPGLVVHPAPGHHSGTVANAILHHCRENLPSGGDPLRPGIIHRLDRETSGALVVAKTDRAHESLARQMKKRQIRKEYVALAAGRPKLRKGSIDLAIGRDPKDRKKMKGFTEASPPAIREARTLYAIEREWPALDLALLRLTLVTGRTHQIRVHLAAIHCPVVGDPVYGRPRYEKVRDPDLKRRLGEFPRQALHAERIAFLHPTTREEIDVTAPWPADLSSLVESLPG